jgi:hypothetical protein
VPRSRALPAYAAPPSPAVGLDIQPLSPVARAFVLQDVNRASYVLPLLIAEGFCTVSNGKPFVIHKV